MVTTPGSSTLTDEGRATLQEIFGKPYVRVASHPHGMTSRAQRRAAAKASKRRNDGRVKETA